MTAAEQDQANVERSAAILRAAGYDLMPLVEPLGKVWHLVGVGPRGNVLVSVVRDHWSDPLGLQRLGPPQGWPLSTLRLEHRYTGASAWPETRILD